LSANSASDGVYSSLTSKEEIEDNLLQRNRRRSLQSLATPFMMKEGLSCYIQPSNHHLMDQLLDGSYTDLIAKESNLNENEKEWIASLKQLVHSEVALTLSIDDFKHFFKKKQERTSSYPSSHDMGHYKTMLECIQQGANSIPNLVITLVHIALSTATPLNRWQRASQVMLEKGKGRYI
jgi:hypothetical protein